MMRRMMATVLIAIVALLFIWFCFTNSSHVHVSFFLGDADIAVFLVILFSFILGFLANMAFMVLRGKSRQKKPARKPISHIVGEI